MHVAILVVIESIDVIEAIVVEAQPREAQRRSVQTAGPKVSKRARPANREIRHEPTARFDQACRHGQRRARSGLRCRLQFAIEGRVDAQATTIDAVHPIALDERLTDFFGEVVTKLDRGSYSSRVMVWARMAAGTRPPAMSNSETTGLMWRAPDVGIVV
ncbi:MAG: hypothetical protein IIB90_17135 [Gemmatimonadetes bacterium]|nr:hypothetical protein [Gemmatimonadota bacterium]